MRPDNCYGYTTYSPMMEEEFKKHNRIRSLNLERRAVNRINMELIAMKADMKDSDLDFNKSIKSLRLIDFHLAKVREQIEGHLKTSE